jgi:membrane protease YdiL (CAAX protease family)
VGLRPVALLAGFAAAVAIRVLIGGVGVAQSAPAGMTFGVCLLALALAAGVRVPVSRRAVGTGVLGALVLCLPVIAGHGDRPLQNAHGFLPWAAVVTFVAVAEEVFLRGALYDAVSRDAGPALAVAVGAVAFALLHVPLYGWHVVPLDLAVGALLGELRRAAGTPTSPAITHVLADLAAWFLR